MKSRIFVFSFLVAVLLLSGVMCARAEKAVGATVRVSADDAGRAINPEFCGLSYEKSKMCGQLFVPENTALINLYKLIGPGVFRIGANNVDKTCWNGLGKLPAITPEQVDALAGFIKATHWRVIYAVNMSVNTPENAASEARYAAKAFGSSLLGFEIGNECDCYEHNGVRPATYSYAQFASEWQRLASAIHEAVPGAVLTGPSDCSIRGKFAPSFAKDKAGVISMLTAHYYRADGRKPDSTLALLLKPDPKMIPSLEKLVDAATQAKLPLGFRCDEAGSFYHGGSPHVSNAHGTSLWVLDFMFLNALHGTQGVNFHGGGHGPGYTPIADNDKTVVQVRPEFYGMKMFALAAQGNVVPAAVKLETPINFTAYAVRRTDGGINTMLINKDTAKSVTVNLHPGVTVTTAESMLLTGPSLQSTDGYTLGGAPIKADGTWSGKCQSLPAASNGQLTITVPPISAVLVKTTVR